MRCCTIGIRVWTVSLLVGLPALALGDTITVRADDWFPINGKPNSRQEGVYIDLMRDILEGAGHEVDYRLLAWDNAVASVQAGEDDCVVGAAPTDAPDFVFARTPWMTFDNAFYAVVDRKLQVKELADLEAFMLGSIEGYSYGDTLDAYIEQNASNPARIQIADPGRNPLNILVNRLVTGKLDLIVESEVVMQAHLAKARLSERVVAVGYLNDPQPIYVACSPAKPSSRTWIGLLDAGFEQHRKAGTLDAFYAKYGLSSQKLLAPSRSR